MPIASLYFRLAFSTLFLTILSLFISIFLFSLWLHTTDQNPI